MINSRIRILLLIFILVSIIALPGCISEDVKPSCTPPPKEFTRSDLVGTWEAKHLNFSHDTLIIKANGKYKQFIHMETPAVDYESEWLQWNIVYDDSGLPYLHLEGMRLCAYAPDLISCEQAGGGEEDASIFNAGYWYDFCKDEMVMMPDEGVLIVVGVSEQFAQPPKGIRLRLLMYTETSWVYEQQSQ